MTDKAGQFAFKLAAAAVPRLLFGLALLASAIGLQPCKAGIAAPASEAVRGVEAIPKPRPVPERWDCGPPAVGPDLIRELTAWVAGHTDYDTTRPMRDPPSIAFCKAGEIIRYEGKDLIVDAQLRAAYDLRRRRIFLVLPWRASDARDVSTLLHDIQFSSHPWPCKGQAEWEAYKLQEAWLAERGLASGFDWPQIFLLSRCPRDVHP